MIYRHTWIGLTLMVISILLQSCSDGDTGAQPIGGGSSGSGCPTFSGPFADRVIQYLPVNSTGASAGEWPFFFQQETLIGAPGCVFDVASLGYDSGATDTLGGSVVLGLGTEGVPSIPVCITDGLGADFAVFENPFVHTEGLKTGTSNEVAVVAVSEDNATWYDFPPALDPGFNPVEREHYTNLAGVTPTKEGGDRFDLVDAVPTPILEAGFRACYVKLTDGGTLYPDYGNTQSDLYDSGADIDAVQALNYETAPDLTD